MSNWFTRLFKKSEKSKYGTDGLTDAERTVNERRQMFADRAVGNDGLTDREREQYAKQWRNGAGSKTVSTGERAALEAARAKRRTPPTYSSGQAISRPDDTTLWNTLGVAAIFSATDNDSSSSSSSSSYDSGSSSSSDSGSSYDSGSSSSSSDF